MGSYSKKSETYFLGKQELLGSQVRRYNDNPSHLHTLPISQAETSTGRLRVVWAWAMKPLGCRRSAGWVGTWCVFSCSWSAFHDMKPSASKSNMRFHISYVHTYVHTCMHTYIHAYLRTYERTFVSHHCLE